MLYNPKIYYIAVQAKKIIDKLNNEVVHSPWHGGWDGASYKHVIKHMKIVAKATRLSLSTIKWIVIRLYLLNSITDVQYNHEKEEWERSLTIDYLPPCTFDTYIDWIKRGDSMVTPDYFNMPATVDAMGEIESMLKW